ncbi:hypothetical protein V8C44DRAFT_330904 [Trichoderma aethiopicum]
MGSIEIDHTGILVFVAILTIATCHLVSERLTRSTVKPKETEEPTVAPNLTFRVSGVPIDWDRERLRVSLTAETNIKDVSIKSLAHEANTDFQTATATLGNAPSTLRNVQNWQIRIPETPNAQTAGPQWLVVERDFLGITTLYAPPPDDHKIDIVALSGLGGHAFGSFRERKGAHMWLRDSLPKHLTSETDGKPMARVMVYGYDSAVAKSKCMQNIEDLSTTFHNSLLASAGASPTRPIILIGHSLGGLIIKQSLITLSRSKIPDDQRLFRAIYGVVFFGTPHDGMDISSLIPMVRDGPNRFLLESMSRMNSQILSIQQRDFHKALGGEGKSEVFCFYETLESPTAQEVNGQWRMTGPPTILVTKSSATHCRPWEDGSEHICAIARTHSEMVKFGPHDPDYKNVKERLRGLSRRAHMARHRLQATTAKFLVPYSQNPNFVGRSEILDMIKMQFGLGQPQDRSDSRRRMALYGLGGVGKTQVALAYIYWLKETCPDVSVFWVHASNADRFRAAFASIAEKCNIPGREDPERNILVLVKKWLEDQVKMRWLLVIDNADDLALFFASQQKGDTSSPDAEAHDSNNFVQYMPDCNHGSVLITTRNKQVGVRLCQGNAPTEVPKLTSHEAHQLVQNILKQTVPPEELSSLSARLEHLPLALAQATSFIHENSISINQYLRLLDEDDATLVEQLSEPFETVGRDSETPHAVTATWIISFKQIEKNHPLASDLLCFMSIMHFQAIPSELVRGYCSTRDPDHTVGETSLRMKKALGVLKAFSFISEGSRCSVNMHRLVHLVTQKWLINNNRMTKFVTCTNRLLWAIFPEEVTVFSAASCRQYLPHAMSALSKEGTDFSEECSAKGLLLHKMAHYCAYQRGWKAMECFLTESIYLQAQKPLDELLQCHLLSSINSLAVAYERQGRYEDAEGLIGPTIEMMKRLLGNDHPHTLTCMGTLASIWYKQDRWSEAESLEKQILDARKRILGEDDPETLRCKKNLALLYAQQGRQEEAEALQLEIQATEPEILEIRHLGPFGDLKNLVSVTFR